jgi:hypothetical protein
MTSSCFSVHPGVEMGARMVARLPEKTGRSLDEWVELIRAEHPSESRGAVRSHTAWLESEYGLGTHYATLLAEAAEGLGRERWDPDAYLEVAPGYVTAMYEGEKRHLEPIYQALLEVGLALGDDVRVSPTKTFVPLYRLHVFAQIKPTTQTCIDLGLALGETVGTGRLIDTGGLAQGDRITHRIPVHSVDEVDDEVARWLRTAYELDA